MSNRRFSFLMALIMIVIAWGFVLYGTSKGIKVSPDSAIYIDVARNIHNGAGFVMPITMVPMTHYPPLYPLTLLPAWAIRIPATLLAKLTNLIILSGIIILSVALSTRLCSRYPFIPAIFIATHPAIIDIHSSVWSEPLFILTGWLGVLFIGLYLDKRRVRWLLLAGFFTAAAWLTRYIGAAFVIGNALGLLLLSRKKIRDLSIFCGLASAPMLIWLIHNFASASNDPQRHFAVRTVDPAQALVIVAFLVGFAILYLYARKNKDDLLTVFGLVGLAYISLLFLTVFFFDETPVDGRLLSPVVFLSAIAFFAIPLRKFAKAKGLAIAIAVFALAFQLTNTVQNVYIVHNLGLYQSDGSWGVTIPPHNWQLP